MTWRTILVILLGTLLFSGFGLSPSGSTSRCNTCY